MRETINKETNVTDSNVSSFDDKSFPSVYIHFLVIK